MSCEPTSWANGTLEDAISMLAKRAAVARTLRRRFAEKQAEGGGLGGMLNDGVSALQRQFKLNPALMSTLGGAVAGAGLGGLSNLSADKEDRHMGRSMLTGALGGAGVGFGGYAASRMLPQLLNKINPPPGSLNFDTGGGQRQIDVPAINSNPEVIQEIEKLRHRSPITKAIGAVHDFGANYYKNHPFLAMLLAGDIGSNMAGTAAGWTSGLPGVRPNVFRAGLQSLTGDEKTPGSKIFSHILNTASPEHIKDMLMKAREAGSDGAIDIAHMLGNKGHELLPGGKLPVSRLKDVYDAGSPMGGIRQGGVQDIADLVNYARKNVSRAIGGKGNTAHIGNPGIFQKAIPPGMPKVNIPGLDRLSEAAKKLYAGRSFGHGATSMLGKLGPRAALYAGVPALQHVLGIAAQESANKQKLQDIMQQFSTPVGN
jgi:hypothetical protein